jgi:hypothetical protein
MGDGMAMQDDQIGVSGCDRLPCCEIEGRQALLIVARDKGHGIGGGQQPAQAQAIGQQPVTEF